MVPLFQFPQSYEATTNNINIGMKRRQGSSHFEPFSNTHHEISALLETIASMCQERFIEDLNRFTMVSHRSEQLSRALDAIRAVPADANRDPDAKFRPWLTPPTIKRELLELISVNKAANILRQAE